MLLQNIFSEIEQVDPEVYERLNSRRNMFRFGAKVVAAAVPMAFGASLKSAYAQTGNVAKIIDILNFALLPEYLETSFYNPALDSSSVIPAQDRLFWEEIRDNENHHVGFIRQTIVALGGTPIERPKFDYTAKGKYPNPFTNYEVFKTLAQGFEDTGVRAYKGQAPNLMDNDTILQAALQIHSVEARHAAGIRKLRGVSPWISYADSAGAAPEIYKGEDALIQVAGQPINISSLVVAMGIDNMAVTEAFDEPLTRQEVMEIIKPFLA